jgi:hypothetical protein
MRRATRAASKAIAANGVMSFHRNSCLILQLAANRLDFTKSVSRQQEIVKKCHACTFRKFTSSLLFPAIPACETPFSGSTWCKCAESLKIKIQGLAPLHDHNLRKFVVFGLYFRRGISRIGRQFNIR